MKKTTLLLTLLFTCTIGTSVFANTTQGENSTQVQQNEQKIQIQDNELENKKDIRWTDGLIAYNPASGTMRISSRIQNVDISFNVNDRKNFVGYGYTQQGQLVKAAQIVLNGYLSHYNRPTLAVDGYFGPATFEAIKSFQRSYSLSADGIIGTKTWKELYYR